MLDPGAPVAKPASGPAPAAVGDAPARRIPPRRLVPWLGVVALIVQGAIQGTQGVLLPNQLLRIDAGQKVTNLAIVTSVSFAVAILVQPLVGTLSDRTRSRLGRRAPWMLAGAASTGIALTTMGFLASIPAIAVCWVLVQISFNVMLAPSSALMPDRLPVERRGGASALAGLGFMVGAALATVAGGALASRLPLGYALFGLVVVIGIVLFVVFNPDRTTVGPAEPFRWRSLVAAFWVNPRKHPDFAWAFAARLLFTVSYYSVVTFSFYMLTDYAHLSVAEANGGVGAISASTVIAAILGILVGGLGSDRLNRRKPFIYAASVLMAIGLAIPLIWPSFPGMIGLAACFGLGFGLYQSADGVLMSLVLPNPNQSAAKDIGVLNLANTIPQAIAPAIGGALVVATGGYTSLFMAGIVISLVAALVIIPVRGVR
ncbi:MFS transporter [Leifsonia sp. ZF2019]|uniref:MFS transporter n=1 Tax=Leifsonia sp. ZF2019 TaxID=2781978 RepID=UPI001CBD4ADE|nr:MFS transporter [Leifsonia sp. ZF2019]UAJ79325.1 MFS transporter [Leifsonia sp. ZF2019]